MRRPRWTWLLAALLLVGLLAMHGLASQPASGDHAASGMVMASADGSAHEAAPTHEGGHGGMPDCGGLMMLCLALMVSVLGFVLARHRATRRVLWRRARSSLIRLGEVRRPFEPLTSLQRTAVIRC